MTELGLENLSQACDSLEELRNDNPTQFKNLQQAMKILQEQQWSDDYFIGIRKMTAIAERMVRSVGWPISTAARWTYNKARRKDRWEEFFAAVERDFNNMGDDVWDAIFEAARDNTTGDIEANLVKIFNIGHLKDNNHRTHLHTPYCKKCKAIHKGYCPPDRRIPAHVVYEGMTFDIRRNGHVYKLIEKAWELYDKASEPVRLRTHFASLTAVQVRYDDMFDDPHSDMSKLLAEEPQFLSLMLEQRDMYGFKGMSVYGIMRLVLRRFVEHILKTEIQKEEETNA